jgi:hypothetical protein
MKRKGYCSPGREFFHTIAFSNRPSFKKASYNLQSNIKIKMNLIFL